MTTYPAEVMGARIGLFLFGFVVILLPRHTSHTCALRPAPCLNCRYGDSHIICENPLENEIGQRIIRQARWQSRVSFTDSSAARHGLCATRRLDAAKLART